MRWGIFLILIGAVIFRSSHLKNESKRQESLRLEKTMLEQATEEQSASQEQVLQGETTIDEAAIGVIRIDKIDVLLPLFENTSKRNLKAGAGVVETTDLPESKDYTLSVVAGHRGSSNGLDYFLNIGKLEAGDEILITTRTEILHYTVTGDEVIEPDDWSRFTREAGKTKLYLMSCHPYPINNKRLLVKAELVEHEEL